MAQQLTTLEWRARYLFGVPDVDPATGKSFHPEDYEYHLALGYETLSTVLNMPILPEMVTDETHDYYSQDYQNWAWLQLFRYPVREVTSVRGRLPMNESLITFPTEWVVCDKRAGHVQLIPTQGSVAQYLIGASSMFLPLLARGSYLPGFWKVSYTAGFEDGQIPNELNDAAAKFACISLCNVLGDLLGGVGVLGGSIGLDGLSQFISMTKTATTSAFYARVLQYRTELWGQGGGPGSQLYHLKRKYQGIRMINL